MKISPSKLLKANYAMSLLYSLVAMNLYTNQLCRTLLPSLDYNSIFLWECSAHSDSALSIQMSVSVQTELFFCILQGLKACIKIYEPSI